MKKCMGNDKLPYRFLVTGGAGFIGSNVCEYLLANGATHVTTVDNLFSGSMFNIQELQKDKRFTFIHADVNDTRAYAYELSQVDVVIHLAAIGSVPKSVLDPLATNEANVTGTLALLHAISKLDHKPYIIFSSSSSVYGNDTHYPKQEAFLGEPLSPYAVSKRADELYLQVFSSLHNINITVFRFFNVFGRRQNPKGPYAAVIPQFILNMLQQKPVTIYGDGLQTRDFTYIDNILHGIHLAIEKRIQGYHVFNIAGGKAYSVVELFSILKNHLNYPFEPVFAEPRAGDIRKSLADLQKAETYLGYHPTVSFEEGLIKTIEWYKEHLKYYVLS
jgi:nucleoside-diphosphate-sugar epimerase